MRVLLLLLASLPLVSDGVETVIFRIGGNNAFPEYPRTTYTVPANKVLLIEHLFHRIGNKIFKLNIKRFFPKIIVQVSNQV